MQQDALYFANVSVGTPPQQLRLHIDTGSSDLWINSATSQLCQQSTQEDEQNEELPCTISGTYNANASSSYTYVNSLFNISYVDGSGAQGDYVTDTLHIGGSDLPGLQMGIGYDSTSSEGVMGIGYPQLEVQVQVNNDKSYLNVPALMASKGVIQSNAYSLWLDDLEASTGSILFGGVDSDKYHGQLSTLPIQAERGVFQEFIIVLTGVDLVSQGQNTSLQIPQIPVLLDSGSTLSYLPPATCEIMFKALGVQYDEQAEQGYIACSSQNDASTLDFSFSGAVISVPMSELVLPGGTDAEGNTLTLSNGEAACSFGISVGSDDSGYTLGDTFIRSAYVVYDIDNNEISLAQTNFNATTSNIQVIGKTVPDATGVASAATVQVTQTNGGRLGGPPTGTAHLTGTATATAPKSTAKGGAGSAQVPLGALAGIAGAGLLLAL